MRSLTLCLIFCLKICIVFGQYQDNISVTLPSPNNIGNATTTSFNYYNGTPSISLPLYTLESPELKVPIGINYQATGVKLHQYASTVGINWNLQAGGSITRVIRGRPDESDSGYIGANRTGLNINGGNEVDAGRSDKIASGEWDGEPDLFFITTPFESNSFVFDENKGIVFTKPSRLQLSMTSPAGTNNYTNVSWVAVDESGNRFTFGTTNNSKEILQEGASFVSTWLLDQVSNFNRTDEIKFEYITGQNISTNKFIRGRTTFTTSGTCSGQPEVNWENPMPSTYAAPKYLSKISCTSGNVEFKYADDRLDQVNGKRLVLINIYNNANFLKCIRFRHHYYGTPDGNKDLNRLALQDVYVVGQDQVSSIKLYSFNYFNNPAYKFPARNSVAIDHWGYYNNNSNSTPCPPQALKDPDLGKTKQYTLYEIEYGLGGKTTYEYELNDYWDPATSSTKLAGGLRLKTITETDNTGKAVVKSFSYRVEGSTTQSSGEPFINSFVYNNTVTHLIAMPPVGACTIYGETYYNTLFYNTFDINKPHVGYSRVKVTNADGGSEVYQFTNFSNYPDEFKIVNANLGTIWSINQKRQFGYSTSYAHRRGLLRFKQFFNSAGDKVEETEYQYTALAVPEKKARGISITLEWFSNFDTRRWYQNIYYHIKDNFQLTKEIKRTYDTQDFSRVQEQERTYEYNPDGTLLRKMNYTNSMGASYAMKYYYPENRSEISGLSAEDNTSYQHMDKLATKIREEKILPSGQKQIRHFSYKTVSLGGAPPDIKVFPSTVQESNYGGAFVEESRYIYSSIAGIMRFEIGIDGIPKVYLYNSLRDLTATIVNASLGEVYFEDFEEHTSATSGEGATGSRYWTGSFQVPFTKPDAKKYFLSYSRLVNGKWEPIRIEYTTNNMTIAGTYPIDNVAVLPEDAYMFNYVTIPGVGHASVTEPNGTTAFYEYDIFQRMRVVRNNDRKIVKVYDYGSACDCPLPLVYASVEYRNDYTINLEDYYAHEVEVVVKFKDANGNPFQADGLPFSVKEITDTDLVISELTYTHTANGTEYSLGRFFIYEEYYRDAVPWRYIARQYELIPSPLYIIQQQN
ncbi:hypothetical protein [Chitinophaga sp. YIM B06452]|uniref:hypothetical protein n=1 Tax=Chitinophaga sp. YIM B06452 TaxID=3082158 RepID=UPI0031FEAC36